MICCSHDWAKLGTALSGFLTPVIAALAVYIAWQQYFINRRQLSHALFDRRWIVFVSTMELIVAAIRTSSVTLDDISKFDLGTREHEFLFGSDIGRYLAEVRNKAVDLYAQNAAVPEEAATRTKIMLWFSGQGEKAREKFARYMAFDEIR
jgi:hypothetical protein